jgi:biotin transporter BioY
MFVAHLKPEIDLFCVVIVLLSFVLVTVLFISAHVRGDHILLKSKPLRTLASCIVVVAVLFGCGAIYFGVYITPVGSEVKLSYVTIVLLNFVQAALLSVWADLKDKRQISQ